MNTKSRYPSITELFKRNRATDIITPQPKLLENITTHVELKDFERIKKIGKGGYSSVYLVKKHNTFYALKVLSKLHLQQTNQQKGAMNEKKVMQSLDSNFIVKMSATMNEPGWIGMVIDYIGGRDMYYWLKKCKSFDESWVVFYSGQVVLALEYLHTNRIIYRDIKPENILMDLNGYIKLSDFGFARQITTDIQRVESFCGTPEYIAPEILKGTPYNYKVDMWSLGILIHELVVGKTPFNGIDLPTVYDNIQKNKVKFGNCSLECITLLRKLLEVEKKRIATAGEVKKEVWFGELCWDDLASQKVVPPFVPLLMPILKVNEDIEEMDKLMVHYKGTTEKVTISFEDF